MKKSVKAKNCKCVEQVQEKLRAEHNGELYIGVMMNLETGKMTDSPPALRVVKLNSRSRKALPGIFCTYCPFCGKKFPRGV